MTGASCASSSRRRVARGSPSSTRSVQELDDELRGILTKRDVEVLSRALPRVHTYFEQHKEKEVSDVRR